MSSRKKRPQPLTTQQLLARLPQHMRPRMNSRKRRDLELAHLVNLDALHHGQCTPDIYWDILGATLTLIAMSDALGLHAAEARQAYDTVIDIGQRSATTGRLEATPAEYTLLRDNINRACELEASIDEVTAMACATWSDEVVNQIAAQHQARAAGQPTEPYDLLLQQLFSMVKPTPTTPTGAQP